MTKTEAMTPRRVRCLRPSGPKRVTVRWREDVLVESFRILNDLRIPNYDGIDPDGIIKE